MMLAPANMRAASPPTSNASPEADRIPPSGSGCIHCGLPIPQAAAELNPGFCCGGCATAYAIIHACGLDRYYALRRELASDIPAPSMPEPDASRRYAELDDPAFQAGAVRATPAGLRATDLLLENVHCAACVWLVERLPTLLPGVVEARLDFRRAIARVTWDPKAIRLSEIARLLRRLGYPPHPARTEAAHRAQTAEERRMIARLGVAAACASITMLFALALYAGLFSGIEPATAQLLRWVSMGVTIVSLAWPGQAFFRSAASSIRAHAPNLDVPISLALLAGGLWSLLATVRGHGEVYFDSLSALVFLLLVGRFIQRRQQRRAADSVELLFTLTSSAARLVQPDGGVREAPIEALRPGDVVEVRAGDSFPADGMVVQGESAADLSLLTGESRPVPIAPGAEAVAGGVNLGGTVMVQVRASGEATRAGRLMKAVEEASSRRAPIVRTADRAAGWFLGGMTLVATLTFALWLPSGAGVAIEHAIAVLVVTCPCALGLATPLAFSVGIGRAARTGAFIKGGDAIQRLSRPGRLILDKTGTLTTGRLAVTDWTGPAHVKPLVAALESTSSHPIALALSRDLSSTTDPSRPLTVTRATHTLGAGLRGVVEGRDLAVGTLAFVAPLVSAVPPALLRAHDRALAAGHSPTAIALDGQLVALAAVGDALRPDARAALDRLRASGWQVEVLSGDHPAIVERVAAQLAIPPEKARGGLSPECKLAALTRAAADGPVVMVGDGVNDAASLAAADVGIAVHGGAEASLAAADIYLGRPGLTPLVQLIEGCRRTMNIVRLALTLSTLYNVAAGALAIAGLINPLIAALIMPVSSLTALTLCLNLRSFGGRP